MATKQRFYCSGGSTVWCLALGSSVQSNSRSYMEVKGFEKVENSSRVVVSKSDLVVVAPATSSAACLVGNMLDKGTLDIPKFNGCTKSLADFVAKL